MTKDMTTGKIMPLLVKFTIPLVLGNLFQLTYNAVDSIIVGHFVGKEALAAVGICTYDLIFKWSVYGCQHPDGHAVWCQRIRYPAPPDQHHHAFRCCIFRISDPDLRHFRSTDPSSDAGGSVYSGDDHPVSADHLCGPCFYLFV